LWGTSSGGVFEGFQVGVSGSDPTKVDLQVFGPGSGWHQYDLGFDASHVCFNLILFYVIYFIFYCHCFIFNHL
jgi:hypothetical protein